MGKHRNAWSEEDREEFEALCEEAWASSTSQSERTTAFVAGLLDAQQAHRGWATDEINRCVHSGALGVLKRWNKSKASVMLTHDGRVYAKPKTVGITRMDDTGAVYSEQTLFEWLTLEELRVKAREAVINQRSWGANAALYYSLIALCEKAGAETPHQAAKTLGITIEQWLGEERAA